MQKDFCRNRLWLFIWNSINNDYKTWHVQTKCKYEIKENLPKYIYYLFNVSTRTNLLLKNIFTPKLFVPLKVYKSAYETKQIIVKSIDTSIHLKSKNNLNSIGK